MNNVEQTWGWELAAHHDVLKKMLGAYPSFHDSAVRSFCMSRRRETGEGLDGRPLPSGRTRDLVDVRLEVLHDRYGPPPVGRRHNYVVFLDCLDVRTAEIDVNAMLEEATIMEMTLKRVEGGLIQLDLMPNVGFDVLLTCAQVAVSDMQPYIRPAS
ncbi:Imm50 family immunity protein [Paraburkholderia oxyphila]|uniref:Imm50 family immunity protein n=1 Tax=Paraburkholderia oxyphila TaxID=614212 RepID=UPI000488ABCA|nr:Imm50 family immunity protein [Paraburkholderia oxyphila]